MCLGEDGSPTAPRWCSKEGICAAGGASSAPAGSSSASAPASSQLPAPGLVLLGSPREVVDPAWGLASWALCRGAQVEACDRGVAGELAPGSAEGAAVEVTACEEQVRFQRVPRHGGVLGWAACCQGPRAPEAEHSNNPASGLPCALQCSGPPRTLALGGLACCGIDLAKTGEFL